MFQISKLMDNLIKYGHSKLFIPMDNPNENYVMYFYLDIDSNLIVEEGTYTFNKPYWDGYDLDESAYVVNRSITSSFANYKHLISFITTIIVGSMFDYGMYQIADEVYDLNDNDKTLSIIYNYIMSSLDISNSILYKLVDAKEEELVNEIMTYGLKNYKSIPFSKDLAARLVNKKMEDTLNRFYSIESIIRASEKSLPPHTKKLLNKALTRISTDNSNKKVEAKRYIK